MGGAGYLGSHLVEKLSSENHEIVVFDNHSGNVRTLYKQPISFIHGDVRNNEDFLRLDKYGKYDGVFHLAAKKSVPESIEKPDLYLDVNSTGMTNVISFCLERGIQNLVSTSTAAVYGHADGLSVITENSPVSPINPYGLSKLLAEDELNRICNSTFLNAVSLRTFNIIGTGREDFFDSRGENVLPMIVQKLKKSETFTLFGKNYDTKDGTCVRDYLNVKDVADAHILAMMYLELNLNLNSHQILNISSGTGVSIFELISKVEKFSGKKLNWCYSENRPGDPASVIGDNTAAKNVIGWKPLVNIDESIKESLGIFEKPMN